MRKSMMEIVVCPMDKNPLELTIEQEDGDQVIQGYMTCTKCAEKYPIEDRIPNFLPPEMRQAAS